MENKPRLVKSGGKKQPRFSLHAPYRYFASPKLVYENGTIWELNEKEFKLYHYICWRTWGFDKPTDSISLLQMREGVFAADGTIRLAGIGYSDRTLKRVLASLSQKGWITRRRNGSRPTIYSMLTERVVDRQEENLSGQHSGPSNDEEEASLRRFVGPA